MPSQARHFPFNLSDSLISFNANIPNNIPIKTATIGSRKTTDSNDQKLLVMKSRNNSNTKYISHIMLGISNEKTDFFDIFLFIVYYTFND